MKNGHTDLIHNLVLLSILPYRNQIKFYMYLRLKKEIMLFYSIFHHNNSTDLLLSDLIILFSTKATNIKLLYPQKKDYPQAAFFENS